MSLFSRLWFSLLYLRRPPWDSGITPPEFLNFLEDRRPGRAIDLGCGTGTNVITLASYGWQVTGVDFVPAAIKLARKKAQQAGVVANFIVGDVTSLDQALDPFELALDIGCFHGFSEAQKLVYIQQMERILAPHGFWFLYAFLSEQAIPGIFPSDLDFIRSRFRMISYKDGVDRRQRPSAYFTFQKN